MKKHILAVLFLTILTTIFFSPVLFTENTFVFRDFYRYYYPFYHLKVSLIKDGIFPFWNPYLFSGTPLFALPQLGTLYPVSILLYLLPFGLGMKLFIVVHFLLAGIFMYCLGKTIGLETKASLAAGITFMFSSFSLCMISHPNILCSIVWTPLIFAVYHTGLTRRSLLQIIFSGICLAIQILAGEPVMVYMTILALFFYGICSSSGCKYAITSFLTIILIGIGLSLVQLLPFFELTLFSPRAHGVVYQEATDWSLYPGELLNLIVPFFSDVMKLPRQGFLLSMYLGIIPLCMILLSFWKKGQMKWFWTGCFVVSLILSLGSHFFLYPLCYQYLPGFNMIRHAVKFVALMTFCGAVLTGYGFSLLSETGKRFTPRVFLSLLLVCICLWGMGTIKQGVSIWGQVIGGQSYLPIIPIVIILVSLALFYPKAQGQRFILIALLLLTTADLFLHGKSLTPVIPQSFYDQKPAIVKWLERETSPYRCLLNPATKEEGDAVSKKSILFSNLGLLWRIPDAYGYEALTIRDYEKFIWHVRNEDLSSIYHLLCMLNVKYIASETPLLYDGLELADVIQTGARGDTSIPQSSGSGGQSELGHAIRDIRVYRNTNCLNRAFFVPRAVVVADKREAFYYIMRSDFNPTREVVLFEGPAHHPEYRLPNSQVRIDSYQPNRIVIQAKTNASGFLFLGDTYYPGWKAFVDERETRIYRANYIFRAIEIASGNHKIEFVYYPQVFKVGMIGSICVVLLIGVAVRVSASLRYTNRRY